MKNLKKFLALLCSVVLLASLSTAAFAVKTPDQATNESVSATLDATSFSNAFDGCWWNVDGTAYMFLPETWEEQELTEKDIELGYIASFYDPDSVRSVTISLTDLDGLCDSAAEYAEEIMEEYGYTGYENTVNGYPVVIYFDDYNYLNLVMGDSSALIFSFYPADDSEYMEAVYDVIRSITPVETVTADDITDTVLGQVALYGECELPVTITNASASSAITGFFACPAGETEWENILKDGNEIAPGESLSGLTLTIGPAYLSTDFGVRYGDEATLEYPGQDLTALSAAPLEIICEDKGDTASFSLSQTVEQ